MIKRIMLGFVGLGLASVVLAKAPSMPKQFQGTWDESLTSCSPKGTPRSETSKLIDDNGFVLYESMCKLTSIVKLTSHSMTGKFTCESDDGDFKETDTLKLSASGRLSGLDVDHALVKCL